MIVVSACLAGVCCRYDGGHAAHQLVIELLRRSKALPLCPEQLGGLPTPRKPYERRRDRIISQEGKDATGHFVRGAKEALRLARLMGCTAALLKSRSPSCGVDLIYDGEFTGTLVAGQGVFTELLRAHGFSVQSDMDMGMESFVREHLGSGLAGNI